MPFAVNIRGTPENPQNSPDHLTGENNRLTPRISRLFCSGRPARRFPAAPFRGGPARRRPARERPTPLSPTAVPDLAYQVTYPREAPIGPRRRRVCPLGVGPLGVGGLRRGRAGSLRTGSPRTGPGLAGRGRSLRLGHTGSAAPHRPYGGAVPPARAAHRGRPPVGPGRGRARHRKDRAALGRGRGDGGVGVAGGVGPLPGVRGRARALAVDGDHLRARRRGRAHPARTLRDSVCCASPASSRAPCSMAWCARRWPDRSIRASPGRRGRTA